jgi:hypothetical protein
VERRGRIEIRWVPLVGVWEEDKVGPAGGLVGMGQCVTGPLVS